MCKCGGLQTSHPWSGARLRAQQASFLAMPPEFSLQLLEGTLTTVWEAAAFSLPQQNLALGR